MKNINAKWLTALLPVALVFSTFAQTPQTTPRQTAAPAAKGVGPAQQTPNRSAAAALDEGRMSRVPARTGDPRRNIEGDFVEALTLIEDNYVDSDDLEKESGRLKYDNLFKSSIIGMLRSLDPHSNYYDPKEFEELRTEQRSEYFGIGASISSWRLGDDLNTYIMATFPQSPAAKADLRFGDRVLEVDGDSMKGKNSSDVRDKIRGPRGTKVKVKVERASTGAVETVEITRDAVGQPSVPDAYMIRPGVGYIDMSRGFNYSTSGELSSKLELLRDQRMTQLILDLRGNPGGFLEQAVRVAEKFLARGQRILSQKGREGEASYDSRNSTPDTTPLVVLVNGSSASASEIVAGALQDHDRALIVGENSFGKGLVQSIINIDTGSGVAGLTLTSAKYYTPSGRLIQRDYSTGSTYDYYTRGGAVRDRKAAEQQPAKPSGIESRTDSGRVVYGGGGISPDEAVAQKEIPRELQRGQLPYLLDAMFGFTRELSNNRINGLSAYKVQRTIDFTHELQATDFPASNELYEAFKRYVAANPSFKIAPAQLDRIQDFVRRQLRFNIVTAAYGSVAATRVLIADDPQVTRAVEVLPRAKDLALNAQRVRSARQKTFQQ